MTLPLPRYIPANKKLVFCKFFLKYEKKIICLVVSMCYVVFLYNNASKPVTDALSQSTVGNLIMLQVLCLNFIFTCMLLSF